LKQPAQALSARSAQTVWMETGNLSGGPGFIVKLRLKRWLHAISIFACNAPEFTKQGIDMAGR